MMWTRSLLALLLLAACDKPPPPGAAAAKAGSAVAAAVAVAAPPPAAGSAASVTEHPGAAPRPEDPEHPLSTVPLYELEATLRDMDERPVKFDVWRGQPTIIAMFYATCKLACPVLIDEIRAFEDSLPAAQRAALRVLLISFDATRDTAKTLRETATAHGIDPARWHLTTAPEASAREVAAVLGVKYRALDDGEYFHTSVVTLVDGAGVAVARVEGLGRSAAPLVEAMARLVPAAATP
jgi:protein SCO1/2